MEEITIISNNDINYTVNTMNKRDSSTKQIFIRLPSKEAANYLDSQFHIKRTLQHINLGL